MMDGQYWGMGWGTWFLFLLICMGIYFIFKNNVSSPGSGREESPMDILRKRYAGGKITKEQFDEMKKDLM